MLFIHFRGKRGRLLSFSKLINLTTVLFSFSFLNSFVVTDVLIIPNQAGVLGQSSWSQPGGCTPDSTHVAPGWAWVGPGTHGVG